MPTLHPILFTIPLPQGKFPLFSALLGLAVAGVCVALLGVWRRRTGPAVFGVALAGVAGYGSAVFHGHSVEVNEVQVPAWGAMLSIWLLAAWWLSSALARRQGLPLVPFQNCFVVAAIGALLTARLLFVGVCWPDAPSLDLLAVRQGGLLGMGGVVGALAGAALYSRRGRLSFWQWLDVAAPSLGLGMLLLRLGCYLYGCDFGRILTPQAPSWLTALGTFPRWSDPDQGPVFGALAWIEQVRLGALSPQARTALPIHPVQLYESLAGAALVVGSLTWWPRRVFHGQVGLSVLLAYGAIRFVSEVLRADPARGELGPFVEPRVYLPIGLLLIAGAYVYGPALSEADFRRRLASIALSLAPAALALWLARSLTTPSQLSITQWLCLLLCGGVAFAWSRRAPASSALPQHQPEQHGSAQAGGHDSHRQLALGPDDPRQRVARHQKPRADRGGHRQQGP